MENEIRGACSMHESIRKANRILTEESEGKPKAQMGKNMNGFYGEVRSEGLD
jgi:hypothetical protein